MKNYAKILFVFFVFLFLASSIDARVKYLGVAQKGGKTVKTSPSTIFELMETYPGCTVTVYLAGTLTPASIFSDNSGTVKGNPFTSDLVDASFFFYVDNGRYDIKFSGLGIVSPFTNGDILISDSGGIKANISPTYGVTALSVAPSDPTNPVARGMDDIVNPIIINKTNVSAFALAPIGQGIDTTLSGHDDIVDFGIITGGKFKITWNGTTSANHQILFPLYVEMNNTGTGRIDTGIGISSQINQSGGGVTQAVQGYFSQIFNSNGTMGEVANYYADTVQVGSSANINSYAALFRGRFRNFNGTSHIANVYGLMLSGGPAGPSNGWANPSGTVDYSSGIEIDNSIDIGTERWVIHSTSDSSSLLSGNLIIGIIGKQKTLEILGKTSGSVDITVPFVAGSWTLTLPNNAGTNGFVLQTNGTGVTSWVAQSGGGGSSPGGSNTQIQYNNAGVLGGISGATSNGTSVTLTNSTLAGTITASSLTSNGFVKTSGGTGLFTIDTSVFITGNQTITLSGDVSGIGATAITTTIGALKVTNAMLAGSIAASKLIGTDINTVGTITSGVWNAGSVTSNSFITANGNLSSIAATGNVFIKDASTGFLSSTTQLVKMQPSNTFQSSNFTSGLLGWSINALGNAEFENVDVRGAIHASVITYNAILATSGTLGVFKSAAKLKNDVVITASPTYGTTTFTIDATDQEGLTHAASQLFVINDILRLKDGTTGDSWFKVTSVSDQSTFWRYIASIQAGTNNVTFRAGLGIPDYGQSGNGFIILTADQTNAPYEQMATHLGTFSSADASGTLIVTPQLRLGNLNGSYGFGVDTYGFATGQFGVASKTWITVEQTNGIRIGNNSTTLGQWNTAGDIIIGQVSGSQSNTLISAGALTIRTNTTGLFNVDTNGSVRIGTNISAAATTNIFISDVAALYNSESLAIGDILIGDNTAASNFGNIKITGGGIKIRRGITDYITMDATDVQITNILKIKGANSALTIGNPPPTSSVDTTNAGIWIDKNGLYANDGANISLQIVSGVLKFRSAFSMLDSLLLQAKGTGGSTTGVASLVAVSNNNSNSAEVRVNATQTTNYITLHPLLGTFLGVTIGSSSAPTTSAVLDLVSTTGAFLPPRMTTTQRDALTPTDGMILYNSTLATMQYRKAGAWISF